MSNIAVTEQFEPSKSVLYIAINCRWEEAQPILAHDDLQFACWKMMDYKMDCRKGTHYTTQTHESSII